MEISKADWKLYCERVSDWQEHYMEQLNQEYVNLLTSTGNASDHFWELQKRIKQDKKHPGVLIELRKSTVGNITCLCGVYNIGRKDHSKRCISIYYSYGSGK